MKNALFAYKNTDRMKTTEDSSANSILLVIMEELCKSIQMFHANIDNKTGDNERKSRGFSRSLSIIYTLQSSLDLEKGGPIAADLFRLYEFCRINIIQDLRNGKIGRSLDALNSLTEIFNTWQLTNESGKNNG